MTAPPRERCASEDDCTHMPWCKIRGECQRAPAPSAEPTPPLRDPHGLGLRFTPSAELVDEARKIVERQGWTSAEPVQPCIERGCPNPSQMPDSEYCRYHAARQPSAEPPATDDLVRMLRETGHLLGPVLANSAADLIERQAREIARWNELHRVIAEKLDCDVETWPDHRNAPLAIGATFILIKQRAERAEAERDALLSACKRAWALCYDDRGAMNILAQAIDAARGEP